MGLPAAVRIRSGAASLPDRATETEDGVAMVFEEQARRYQELIKRASDLRSYL